MFGPESRDTPGQAGNGYHWDLLTTFSPLPSLPQSQVLLSRGFCQYMSLFVLSQFIISEVSRRQVWMLRNIKKYWSEVERGAVTTVEDRLR